MSDPGLNGSSRVAEGVLESCAPAIGLALEDATVAGHLRKRLGEWGHAVRELGRKDDPERALEDLAETGGPAGALLLIEPECRHWGAGNALEVWCGRHPRVKVIAVSWRSGAEDARRAMRTGALDYLALPFEDGRLRRALIEASGSLRADHGKGRNGASSVSAVAGSGGASVSGGGSDRGRARGPRGLALPREALMDSVWIYGESGTGKEFFARELHAITQAVGDPFVVLGPEGLSGFEVSGLFRGTLFVDDVEDFGGEGQRRLSRILKDARLSWSGGERGRVVMTSRTAPLELVESGRLRGDLFHGWKARVVRMEPLRERLGELKGLLERFTREVAGEAREGTERRAPRWTADAIGRLTEYGWPGNLRELRSLAEWGVGLASERGAGVLTEIGASDLPEGFFVSERAGSGASLAEAGMVSEVYSIAGGLRGEVESGVVSGSASGSGSGSGAGVGGAPTIEGMTRQAILRALREQDGNVSRAARRLGLSKATMYRKLKKFGIDPRRPMAS